MLGRDDPPFRHGSVGQDLGDGSAERNRQATTLIWSFWLFRIGQEHVRVPELGVELLFKVLQRRQQFGEVPSAQEDDDRSPFARLEGCQLAIVAALGVNSKRRRTRAGWWADDPDGEEEGDSGGDCGRESSPAVRD